LVAWVALVGLGSFLAAIAACDEQPPKLDCGALPEGNACPTSKGGTCDDRACDALYQCTETGWAFVQRCAGSAGAGGSAGVAGSGGAAGAGALCQQVTRDAACPELQPPDCDEAAARACPTQACLGSCEVFLTCTSAGWSEELAGYCDEEELVLVSDQAGGAGGAGDP
jgi:hypothetical protein